MGKKVAKQPVKKKVSSKPAAATTVVAADKETTKLELTKHQREAGDKRYLKMVADTRKEEKEASRVVLMAYWNRGQRVASLLADPKHYGCHTAETFGKDIRPEKPYSSDEVRKWHRFFKLYTIDAVEVAVEQSIPWRGMQSLIGMEDPARRKELQAEFATGSITSDDLRNIVKTENVAKRDKAVRSGARVDRRGGVAVSTVYRNVLGFINDFGHKLDDLAEACKRHDKAPVNAESSQAGQRRKECLTSLKKLVPKLNRAMKLSEKK